jgi:hypothetical protein
MNVEIWVQYLMKKKKYLEREKLFPSHNLHNLGYTVYERQFNGVLVQSPQGKIFFLSLHRNNNSTEK